MSHCNMGQLGAEGERGSALSFSNLGIPPGPQRLLIQTNHGERGFRGFCGLDP